MGASRFRRRLSDTDLQPAPAALRNGDLPVCRLLLLLAAFVTAGCNALPPGNLAAIAPPAGPALTQPASQVVLIRGWRDLWSDGIDGLADKLRQAEHPAAVFKEAQWRSVETALAERAAAGGLPKPVVLIGFSWGADDVILISRTLGEFGQPIDLLILIDPVTPADIPPNVRRCVNFYQSNGVMDVFPWLRGVAVRDEPTRTFACPPTENINLRDRPDLLEPGTSHKTIAANARVHEAIVQLLQQLR